MGWNRCGIIPDSTATIHITIVYRGGGRREAYANMFDAVVIIDSSKSMVES